MFSIWRSQSGFLEVGVGHGVPSKTGILTTGADNMNRIRKRRSDRDCSRLTGKPESAGIGKESSESSFRLNDAPDATEIAGHRRSKELMKKRGLDSPDDADALALTFAQVVAPRRVEAPLPKPVSCWS